MRRALLGCALLLAFTGCTAANLELVRRDECERGEAPAHAQLARGDACAALALEESSAGRREAAMRHFVLGCEHGSALACHYALAALPESRNALLEGAGAATGGGEPLVLEGAELASLREAAARVCLERSPALRVCVGAALLFRRVEPRDERRAQALLAHRCRYAGDCAHYEIGYADRDGDLVLDRDDRCPDLAEDVDGRRDEDGCPDLDEDADARRDDEDLCPDAAEDVDGFEDADGCPDPDDDHDGIADAVDACPREAETRNGHRDEDGCPDVSPRCACRFELAAAPAPPVCAAGASDDCRYATLHAEAEALLCLERTRECPGTSLTADPGAPIRELVLRVHAAQLAVSERLRARPRNASTLRAYGDALEREGEALTMASVRLGRAGSTAFSESTAREALARATAAHEDAARALARLAAEDREVITATTAEPTR